ncbi:MAG: hypothetical protein KAW13_07335, partial [Dehalococcoidia bacterium]|nr:hypothetical protein [Dehalococcoidia bacterium]
EYYNNIIREGVRRMAGILGVPVVMANKCGRWRTPMPWLPFWKQDSSFPGLSSIIDSDGTVKAQLRDEEAIIVGDVTLDPSLKIHEPPQCCGRWAWEGHWLRNSLRLIEAYGKLSYSLSSERKKRARRISSAVYSIEKNEE